MLRSFLLLISVVLFISCSSYNICHSILFSTSANTKLISAASHSKSNNIFCEISQSECLGCIKKEIKSLLKVKGCGQVSHKEVCAGYYLRKNRCEFLDMFMLGCVSYRETFAF